MLRAAYEKSAEEMRMRQRFTGPVVARCCSAGLLIAIVSAAILCAGVSEAQNKKKKKSDTTEATTPAPPLGPTDQIEHNIGEMLAAFQVGDADEMHKYYSDNATFVRSGVDAPPIIGWAAYAQDYKGSLSGFQGMQITRRNTLIFTRPDAAWATYQWEFNATASGKSFSAAGETTLVFDKVGDSWLIIHNHTSQICPAAPAPAQPATGAKTPAGL
jgi:ketosteroid isomerase-like protein